MPLPVSRSVFPKAQITQKDLANRLRDIVGHIFERGGPRCRLCDRELDRPHDGIGLGPAKDIAPAFDRLRPFRNIAKGNIRDAEDRTFFLDSTAVGQNGKRIFFEFYKIKKP